MDREALLRTIGENVDRLISLDLGGRGVVGKLHAAARNLYDLPLSYTAAKRLHESLRPGDIVMITTGCIILPYGLGETDGPVGSALLARALERGLSVKPVLVTEESLLEMVKATCRGASMNVVETSRIRDMEGVLAVEGLPNDNELAKGKSDDLLSRLNPKALIAIEKLGPNSKAVYHSMTGLGRTVDAKAGHLFNGAIRRGILTAGIGDGGNEIGMGAIEEAVKKVAPFGSECRCECKSGIADSTKVDVVIPSGVSNWGAYAIEACMSAILQRPDVLHDEDIERRVLTACISSGGIDGITKRPEPSVDRIPLEVHLALLRMLRQIAQMQPH